MVKYAIETAIAAGLFFALVLVFMIDRFALSGGSAENTLKNVKVIGGESRKGNQEKLKLAVTKTFELKDPVTKKPIEKWDDMGKLLTELGEGYRHDEITVEDLVRLHGEKKLNEYDVIFLTCHIDPDKDILKEPLQQYVANGGILYASDWRYDAVAEAFPDMAVENLRHDGDAGAVEADIVDRDLRDALGSKTIHLKFDLDRWKPAAFGGPRVRKLIEGKYRKLKSDEFTTAPLMVRFQFDKGSVIFTSFHNEKQNSEIEKKLLQYLVYSLVTAGVDAEVNLSLNKEGFTPQRTSLLSAPGNQSITKEYKNDHPCVLRFALGFRNDGAKLVFNVKSPTGEQFTKDCESTTILEVTDAAPGTWKYTVTAQNAYANFPFTVTVGEKK